MDHSSFLKSPRVRMLAKRENISKKVTRTNLNYEHHNSKDAFHNLCQKVNTDGTELKLPINL